MKTRTAFGRSLREIRRAKGLTQEDFSDVSSRTYISLLERAGTSPTLDKIEAIATTMKVHPLTLLTLTYQKAGDHRSADEISRKVVTELNTLAQASRARHRSSDR